MKTRHLNLNGLHAVNASIKSDAKFVIRSEIGSAVLNLTISECASNYVCRYSLVIKRIKSLWCSYYVNGIALFICTNSCRLLFILTLRSQFLSLLMPVHGGISSFGGFRSDGLVGVPTQLPMHSVICMHTDLDFVDEQRSLFCCWMTSKSGRRSAN